MKRRALRILQRCGVFSLARAALARRARILMYHNFSDDLDSSAGAVSASAARSQLEYLRQRFQVVPLSHLVDRLHSNLPLEKNSVVLTIDDGRRNCYEIFFPLLREFEMPATFFVVSSFINGEDWIWTDKVLWLAGQPSRPPELSPDRIETHFAFLNRMRPAARTEHIDRIAAGMGSSMPRVPPAKYAPCSWSELREMADSGLVEIGSHTISHPILSTLADNEVGHELNDSRKQIEEGTGKKVRSFCFPNGKPEDYHSTQLQLVRDAGYSSAVVTRFGMPGRTANPYELPRIGVSGYSDPLTFAKCLDGTEFFQSRLLGYR